MSVFTSDGDKAFLDGVHVGCVKNDGGGDYVETPPRAEWTEQQEVALGTFMQKAFQRLKSPYQPEEDD